MRMHRLFSLQNKKTDANASVFLVAGAEGLSPLRVLGNISALRAACKQRLRFETALRRQPYLRCMD